ncbi:MAG TPA: hypothetical protein VN328_11130 [Thermodesulfovibrionales bacterium]|nr:hypothetical protein [Thermodesulfovibrionales bacterium]
MKLFKCSVLFVFVAVFMTSLALADGDVEKGKALFNDPKLGGGTTGKSCNSCHPGGKGLEKVAELKEWRMMGKRYKSLEDVINFDIQKALHGKPLEKNSEEMVNIIAYIKSLNKQ